MNAAVQSCAFASSGEQHNAIHHAVQAACRRIAPTWPLDRFIAVNPWWGFVDQPVQVASDSIGHLCGSPLTMPMDWYLNQYEQGHITDEALGVALRRHGIDTGIDNRIDKFKQTCVKNSSQPVRLALLTDVLDEQRDLLQPTCQDVVTHAIGQHCASWFDQHQASWRPTHNTSLYAAWRDIASHDNAPSLSTGISGIASRIAALPQTHDELIGVVCAALKLTQEEYENYFSALLFSVNGWAAWCAYLRWQAEQQGQTDDHLEQLLAIRLAWEWVLMEDKTSEALLGEWLLTRQKQRNVTDKLNTAVHPNNPAWIWQDALEITWQQHVNSGLLNATLPQKQPARPALQAVFCIDVRSEPMRRALEASNPAIRTHGFAGFFGLPIEYLPLASRHARPQLPGLLAPQLRAVSTAANPSATQRISAKRRFRLGIAQAWENVRTNASSGFGFVEITGLSAAWKLLRASLYGASAVGSDTGGLNAAECNLLHPVLEGITLDDSIELAARVLHAMSLQNDFAPLVLLVGHGSQSANNSHAAGLDCGACCGQTGEINARVLANLLNKPEVRAGLRVKGIALPHDTRFVAGLHNTTTDDIRLFESPLANGTELTQARDWIVQASQRIRAERAPSLNLVGKTPAALAAAFQQRAMDWSQTRPEWGLANNAAFIAAPRERTRHMNLQGRSFLHDYNYANDVNHSVLELILTAPVIVAHWINMQYFASTIDNRRWGSGNKVLHNVVGGNIGVFEGNGGDLRIGLPLQSLHNGENWVHTPLRLSVWIEAPRDAISDVVRRHEKLRQLVHGQWLYLFCIEPDSNRIFRYAVPDTNQQHQQNQPAWVSETLLSI